jgi:hemolysin activation/secretion protein
MRGYRLSRFVAPVMAFGNVEARWVFTDVVIGDQLLEFMGIPFLDFGRVYDNVGNTTLGGMKYAYGIGLRLAWSQSFVVSFDFGFSDEEKGSFYVTFGNIF